MDTKAALIEFFKTKIPALQKERKYWGIPAIEGFSDAYSSEANYADNVAFKNYLHKRWHQSSSKVEKLHLAQVIVSDWGGVKSNKPETLERYVDEIAKDNPKTPIKGVASYSKIFSIVHMKEYAIYDARVAVSLNALQYINGVEGSMAFNYISGRNNITGNEEKKQGFAHTAPFTKACLIKKGWTRIPRDDTYAAYLSLLKQCLKSLPTCELYDLEMALFANAEKLCEEAAKKAGVSLS